MEIKLFDYFKDLEDPRKLTRILHPARNIIYIAFAAILCGMRAWEDFEDFGNERIEFFEKRLDLSNGIPSHDTFDRFFQIIDSKMFARCFANWASAVAGEVEGKVVSIDGKTIRCASKMSDDTLPIHILSAWADENRMVIAQLKLEWQEGKDKQENEIVAIPKLLDNMDIAGATVTIDAIGTQVDIAEKIVEKKGDYVLGVKSNQPTLYGDIERFFDRNPDLPFRETTDFGHGRLETRRCTLSTDLSFLADPGRWKGIAAIAKVHTERLFKRTGEKTEEDRYFITTLTDAQKVLHAVRSHWGVESMHWVLDMDFNEDRSAKRAKNAATNFNAACKIAIALLTHDGYDHGKKKLSIRRKMNKAILNQKYLEHLLSML
ncbi:MAG: ISAs1 family transposase [Fibrobacter sp.]|nr:ISAs1 family transposase [Fibrobacter sp.]